MYTTVKYPKRSNEHITVRLAANVSETDKFKPIVIIRANRLRAFGKTVKPELYRDYY